MAVRFSAGLAASLLSRGMQKSRSPPASECLEPEASSRGAGIIVAEQMGLLSSMDDLPASLGETIVPRPERSAAYGRMLKADGALFDSLYGRNSAFSLARSEVRH